MTLYQGKHRVETTRLQAWDYRSSAWYFVTICTRNRAGMLGTVCGGQAKLSAAGEIAAAELVALAKHYSHVVIDCFIVMPNHVHLILVLDGNHRYSVEPGASIERAVVRKPRFLPPLSGSLSAIIRSYKAGVTRRCRDIGLRDFGWQTRFHEHILRGNIAVNAVRDYIARNPVNWLKDQENSINWWGKVLLGTSKT
jgi:putative transposase